MGSQSQLFTGQKNRKYKKEKHWTGATGEDFGVTTPGGSGRHLGTPNTNICAVTTLSGGTSGSYNSGRGAYEGSFVYCMKTVNAPKVIVFDVSGNINLTSRLKWGEDTGSQVDQEVNYTTIAGQTAPSPGITINSEGIKIAQYSHDIIIQHIRFRTGDTYLDSSDTKPQIPDPLFMAADARFLPIIKNVVIDHVSISWGGDINFGHNANDATYSNIIIGEGLGHPSHIKYGGLAFPHSKGSFSQDDSCGSACGNQVAEINNLLIHNIDRNPFWKSGKGIIANNVIYDYKHGMETSCGEGDLDVSIVGNYIDETASSDISIELVSYPANGNDCYAFWGGNGSTYPLNYFGGQLRQITSWGSNGQISGTNLFTACQLLDCGKGAASSSVLRSAPNSSLWPVGYTAMSAKNAKTYVLANAGARRVDRCGSYPNTSGDCDPVDARYVAEAGVASNTPAFVNYVNDADGTSSCKNWAGSNWGTIPCVRNPENGFVTLDNNGYTGYFQIPANPHQVQASGYTNLEEKLHADALAVEGVAGAGGISAPSNLRIVSP